MSKFEHGLSILTDPGIDAPLEERPTTQCVHCGGHFPTPNFGNSAADRRNRIGRGFCYNCNGFICGAKCQECKPTERMLEELEGTKNPTAVSVAVPSGPQLWLPE